MRACEEYFEILNPVVVRNIMKLLCYIMTTNNRISYIFMILKKTQIVRRISIDIERVLIYK